MDRSWLCRVAGLLIHANDINADCLDELLKRLESRGYRFITLDQMLWSAVRWLEKRAQVSLWLGRWLGERRLGLLGDIVHAPEIVADHRADTHGLAISHRRRVLQLACSHSRGFIQPEAGPSSDRGAPYLTIRTK